MEKTIANSYDDLKEISVKWWPEEIIKLAEEESVIPLLIETFDAFVGIMNAARPSIVSIEAIIKNSKITPNIFLKHLTLLADFGGEVLSRMGDNFSDIFTKDEKGSFGFDYKCPITGENLRYKFKSLPCKNLGNNKLLIDKKAIRKNPDINEIPLINDIIFILLFGSFSTDTKTARNLVECNFKCDLIKYVNSKQRFLDYLKPHYIRVSSIAKGNVNNNRGYALEKYIKEFLKQKLPREYSISKGKITVSSGDKIPFDLVIKNSLNNGFFALEISFQVTTNSVIERKGNEASSRYERIKEIGGFIGYIVDGAGNIKRKNAIEKLIANSHGVYSINKIHLKQLVKKIKECLC